MRKLRLVFSLVLSIALLIGVLLVEYKPVQAVVNNTSTYVALGDSITTGYGLVNFNSNDIKNKSSANNFVNKLSKRLGKKAINLGVEGLDSTRFLQALVKPTTTEQKDTITQIKNASVITISIGGNNIFLPILETLNKRLGKGKSIFNASSEEIQVAVLRMLLDKAAINELQNDLVSSAAKFNGDAELKKTGEFATIISSIKKLNPKTQIIVQTIYNPFKSMLTPIFDTAIKSMNNEIIKGSENGKNYKVADVYCAFAKAKNGTKLVNADLGTSFDPHPSAKGHEVIYTLVAYVAQNNTLPYNVKSTITKGKLTTKVSEGELILSITPIKGYMVPKSISLAIGKGSINTLMLKNGAVSVPIADVGSDIVVTGVCTK